MKAVLHSIVDLLDIFHISESLPGFIKLLRLAYNSYGDELEEVSKV